MFKDEFCTCDETCTCEHGEPCACDVMVVDPHCQWCLGHLKPEQEETWRKGYLAKLD